MNLLFPKVLSVEIGNHSTKVLQVKKMGTKRVIEKSLMFQTPPGVMEDSRILNVQTLASELKKRLKAAGMKVKDVVVTLSGTSIITRDVVLPKAKKSELDRIIEMNSSEYLPVNMEGYILDYKVLKEMKVDGGAQYRILLVAAPKQLIEGYTDLASACGLHICSIDYSGNSVYKMLRSEISKRNKEEKQQKKTVAVIDMGSTTTMVAIVSEGVLEFNRILLYGSDNISMAISQRLGITIEEAEKMKINKGQLVYLDEEEMESEKVLISDSIKSILINYTDDITRFFEYYNSRKTGNNIDTIYTMGAGCQIQGLEEYFEKAFNIRTERLSEFKSITSTPSNEFKENLIYFGVCLGAAL